MIHDMRGDGRTWIVLQDHGIRFLETSAKANIQIDKAFYDLAEAILAKVGL